MADTAYSGAQPLPESFYLPLMSDSSGDVYPGNTLSHFRVQLESPLYLGDAEWLCGVAEVMWPPLAGKRARRDFHTHENGTLASAAEEATRGAAVIREDEDADIAPSADSAAAASAAEPAAPLRGIPAEAEKEKDQSAQGEGLYLPAHGVLSTPQTEEASAQPPLSSARQENVKGAAHRHPRSADSIEDGARAFIYSDLMRPALVSDFRGKCLRIVPMNKKTRHQTMYPVYYYAVEKRVIDTIYIEVKNKYNEYMPFTSSDQGLAVVLHFKKAAVAQ